MGNLEDMIVTRLSDGFTIKYKDIEYNYRGVYNDKVVEEKKQLVIERYNKSLKRYIIKSWP